MESHTDRLANSLVAVYRLREHSPLRVRLLHLAAVSGLATALLLLLPASLLTAAEPDWSFFDSFYYCFISLTTVGLGDFIPGDSPAQTARSAYKALRQSQNLF